MAVAAANIRIPPGRTIVMLEAQFPSNYYVWQRVAVRDGAQVLIVRSEEHTSELQSLMRISYAVFCLKHKRHYTDHHHLSTATHITYSNLTPSTTHLQLYI